MLSFSLMRCLVAFAYRFFVESYTKRGNRTATTMMMLIMVVTNVVMTIMMLLGFAGANIFVFHVPINWTDDDFNAHFSPLLHSIRELRRLPRC